MSYMQCYRPVEQDACYQQAKPQQPIYPNSHSAGMYDTFQHTNQQQHHNAHGFPGQTHSAGGYNNFNGHSTTHGQGGYGVTPYQTHSNPNVSGYNTHKYGTGFIGSTGHPAQHGSHTMSSALGSFKSEKKMKEKYSSEYKKKSSGHKKNKNKCGNGSGSDSSGGSGGSDSD